MYKIIALVGQAGSGKDTIMKRVAECTPNLHEIVGVTTRPIRENEVDGINYFFLTPEQFGDKVLHGEMLEASTFRDWFYGTAYESLRSDCVNIGVFNPDSIESLMSHGDIELDIYYITATDKERMLRQLNREKEPDVHEIVRRFKADWMDFDVLDFDYTELPNNTYADLENAVNHIHNLYKGKIS